MSKNFFFYLTNKMSTALVKRKYQQFVDWNHRPALYRANRINLLARRATGKVVSIAARNLIRKGVRHYIERKRVEKLAQSIASQVRRRYQNKNKKKRPRTVITASGGTSHTTTKMIVRRTPKEQRSLRKYFKMNPIKNMYVNRFGFAWMGTTAASRTTWYSVCNLKFNNVSDYMKGRITSAAQAVGTNPNIVGQNVGAAVGNGPDALIYIGKCTYSYELYNPTNYILTVYIYDLICKHDTPYMIAYGEDTNDQYHCQPEACMYKGTRAITDSEQGNNGSWKVSDNTVENGTTYYNSVGMKPTDYHYFNTFWKVKGMKKIILPPTSSHQHVVVYNPKKVFTNASLYFPRHTTADTAKIGLGGVTCATLFGFSGQVAAEDDVHDSANNNKVGMLPGKLVISCVRKENVWNLLVRSTNIIQGSDLKDRFTKPTIFTDLSEQIATDTGSNEMEEEPSTS